MLYFLFQIAEHIKNLKSDVSENDTEDELVRKKVREELKKMAPFMPQVINIPKTSLSVVRIYILYKMVNISFGYRSKIF